MSNIALLYTFFVSVTEKGQKRTIDSATPQKNELYYGRINCTHLLFCPVAASPDDDGDAVDGGAGMQRPICCWPVGRRTWCRAGVVVVGWKGDAVAVVVNGRDGHGYGE